MVRFSVASLGQHYATDVLGGIRRRAEDGTS